jgi:hypothetical protein
MKYIDMIQVKQTSDGDMAFAQGALLCLAWALDHLEDKDMDGFVRNIEMAECALIPLLHYHGSYRVKEMYIRRGDREEKPKENKTALIEEERTNG